MNNIVVFSESFFPSLGGLERNTNSLCLALLELGYRVQLLTFTNAKSQADYWPYVVKRIEKRTELIKEVKRSDFIIVNGGISLKVLLPSILFRKKYAIIYQTSSLHIRDGKSILTKINNALRKWFVQKASINIATSEFGREQLSQFDKKSVSLLNPIDVDLEKLAPTLKSGIIEKKYDLLFAGRLIEGKGIFLLAKVISELQRENSITFAVAGDGSDKEKFFHYCNTIKTNFEYLGILDKESLLSAYISAKLLIVPSTTHVEGSPLVIAESIYLGTPVIVSNQPAMLNAIGKAGDFFITGNEDSLKDCIAANLLNRNKLQTITVNCKEEADRFSFSNYKDKIAAILLKVK
ncbi:MAG: glycosyltransferase family 4 protein [Sphingobacteriia bacterium]|nr:glycosyltransferase family 4 protein [Sphingobacteriia bacterium]